MNDDEPNALDAIGKAVARSQREYVSVRGWVAPTAPRLDSTTPAADTVARSRAVLDPDRLARNRLLGGDGHDDPMVADTYRLLRTRVLHKLRNAGAKSLGVTSPAPKAGKTVTAVNLAISMAREGNYQVVLVDADIRNPSIADYLGLSFQYGLPDYLAGDVPLEQVLVTVTNFPGLTLLPGARQRMTGSALELLKSDRMKNLVQSLPEAGSTTVGIVDLPPTLVGDDVIALAGTLDAILLVVDEGYTTIDQIKQSIEHLAGYNVIGTVLNKSSERPKAFENYYHAEHGDRKRSRRRKTTVDNPAPTV